MSAHEKQVGGSHYQDMDIQPWAAMRAWFTPEEYRGYLKGNAIKYLARAHRKGGTEDYRKAEHYLSELNEFMAQQSEADESPNTGTPFMGQVFEDAANCNVEGEWRPIPEPEKAGGTA